MADYGSMVTDKAVAKTLAKIQKVYEEAERDLKKKMAAFVRKHQAQGTIMFNQLKNGQISQAAYHSWMRGQVFTGKRWQMKLFQAVRIFTKATKVANDIIRKFKIYVFTENYNRNAYQTEIQTGISFDIYNEDAVEKLIKEDPKMLPEWKINEKKDYTWNRQKVENAITQGIIQGESVDQIADRLAKELNSTNTNKMRMFARTAMTGAQNAGRQKQMEDAVARGINIRKQWIATLDDRTRDTHQHLDGQIVKVDELFHVGTKQGQKTIRYPGDPTASPDMVYNCRCTMKSVFKVMEGQKRQRRAYKWVGDHRESYLIDDMTYDEWKKWKEGQK